MQKTKHLYLNTSFKKIFVASTLSMLVQYLVTISDKIIAGQMVGERGIAVVTILEPFVSIIVFLAYLVADGSDMLITLALSRNNKKQADEYFSQAVLLSFGGAVVLVLFYLVFQTPIVTAVAGNPEIYAMAKPYFVFVALSALPRVLGITLYSIVLYQGGETYCNYYSGIVVFTNIGLSVLLCNIMGIAGIALATVISEIISLTPFVYFYLSKKATVVFKWKLRLQNIKTLLQISFSKSSFFLFLPIFELIVNSYLLMWHGENQVVVFALVMNIIIFYSTFFEGITSFLDVNMNTCLGEKNYAGIFQIMRFCNRVCITESVIIVAAIMLFARPIVAVFGIVNPAIIDEAVFALRILAVTAISSCFVDVYRNYYVNLGQNKLCILFNVVKFFPFPLGLLIVLGNTQITYGLWIGITVGTLISHIILALVIKFFYHPRPFPYLLPPQIAHSQKLWECYLEPAQLANVKQQIDESCVAFGVSPALQQQTQTYFDTVIQHMVKTEPKPHKVVVQYFMDFGDNFKAILKTTSDHLQTPTNESLSDTMSDLDLNQTNLQGDTRIILSAKATNTKQRALKSYKKSELGKKFVAVFLVLGVLISTVVVGVGVYSFTRYIEDEYKTKATQIANITQGYFTQDELLYYTQVSLAHETPEDAMATMQKDGTLERYHELMEKMEDLRNVMQVSDIYVAYLDLETTAQYTDEQEDWTPVSFVIDVCADKDSVYPITTKTGFDTEYIEEANNMLETGKTSAMTMFVDTEYGREIFFIEPAFIGNTTIIIGVEMALSTLNSTISSYVRTTVFLSLLLIGCFIFFVMLYLYRTVVFPIKLLANEVTNYAAHGTALSAKVKDIHTNDEIEELSQSLLVLQRQSDMPNDKTE